MKTCVKCGKEAYIVNKEGECYNCMSESDKKLAEFQYKALKKQMEGDSGNSSGKSLEEQLEEEKTLREDYESKLRLIAEQTFERKKKELNAPEWIKSPSALNQWIEANNDGKGGSGSVSLRGEDISREKGNSGKLEFDSQEELIDYLRSESQKGNQEAKEQLNQLWTKVLRGIREQPRKVLGFEIEQKDCLEKLKEAQNRDWKKRQGFGDRE